MLAPMPQITVENLVKTYRIAARNPGIWGALRGVVRRQYRTVRALDGISFALDEGELIGYIGPNGAGKSTTVKVLAGILVPDSGECQILGRVPWRERIAHVARIGVVFGQRTQLWWDLPVVESFDLLRDIYRMPPTDYPPAATNSSPYSISSHCSTCRCASCRWASACAAISPPPSCTGRVCSSSTNPPSASTRCRSWRCATV